MTAPVTPLGLLGTAQACAQADLVVTITVDCDGYRGEVEVPLWVLGAAGFIFIITFRYLIAFLLWTSPPNDSVKRSPSAEPEVLAVLKVMSQQLQLFEEMLWLLENRLRLLEKRLQPPGEGPEDIVPYFVTAKGGKLHILDECTNLGQGARLWDMPVPTNVNDWLQKQQKQVFCLTCVARKSLPATALGNTSS